MSRSQPQGQRRAALGGAFILTSFPLKGKLCGEFRRRQAKPEGGRDPHAGSEPRGPGAGFGPAPAPARPRGRPAQPPRPEPAARRVEPHSACFGRRPAVHTLRSALGGGGSGRLRRPGSACGHHDGKVTAPSARPTESVVRAGRIPAAPRRAPQPRGRPGRQLLAGLGVSPPPTHAGQRPVKLLLASQPRSERWLGGASAPAQGLTLAKWRSAETQTVGFVSLADPQLCGPGGAPPPPPQPCLLRQPGVVKTLTWVKDPCGGPARAGP